MYNWKDRLIDWANRKGAWTHILMGAVIALVITAIILGIAMPRKGVVNTNVVDIGGLKANVVSIVDGLAKKASQMQFDTFVGNVTEALDDQEGDIGGLHTRANNAETRLNAIENDLRELACTPPEGYLIGAFPNYTLHGKANEAGSFTANVHLVYSANVGNATNCTAVLDYFCAAVNWSDTTPTYVPAVTFNGTAWGISEVWFNIGTFELAGKVEKEIDITCAGLNSTWKPSFAYVEVYPVLKG